MPWRPVLLRGQKVIARCDAQGQLVSEGGRVEIRYRASDPKAYRAAISNLAPAAGDVIGDDAVVPGVAVAASSTAGAKSGTTSGKPGAARRSAARPGTAKGPIPEGALIAYTDGACTGNPGPAGLGVVLIDGASRRELSKYLGRATNNIAELTAIEEALLIAVDAVERPFVIHTDSQYSIGVLSQGWKAKANQELIARIKLALKRFSLLELRYVKGHAGIPDNERADELARAAVVAQATSGWVKAR